MKPNFTVWELFGEGGQQFFVNAAKTAITENANYIALSGQTGNVLDDGVHTREIGGMDLSGAECGDQLLGIQSLRGMELLQSCDFRNDNGIGESERFSEFVLKNIPSRSIGTGFENSTQISSWKFDAQRAQRFANRGWVMTKIINYCNAAACATDLHPSANSGECFKPGLDLIQR